MIELPESKISIKRSGIFVSQKVVDYNLKDFFEKILYRFQNELQVLADNWYCYSENGSVGTDNVFALIERSYVGLFNNALIRSFPDDSVLQEYSIHIKEEKRYVRGDYLVKHLSCNEKINILFEAKQREFDGRKYTNEEIRKFLEPFLEQGVKYYEAEKKYYSGTTYISSLIFEWIRTKSKLLTVLDWKNDDEDKVTDYYSVYHTDTAGLMVYGNLKMII